MNKKYKWLSLLMLLFFRHLLIFINYELYCESDSDGSVTGNICSTEAGIHKNRKEHPFSTDNKLDFLFDG